MPANSRSHAAVALHPLHGLFLAFPVGLFPAGLASDVAYLNSSEIQWSNFAAWLIAGALALGAPAVLWSLVRVLGRRARSRALFAALAVMWILGLFNAFQHSHDGWSSVGTAGLALSIASTILALVAGWIGYAAPPRASAWNERAAWERGA